MEDIRSKLEFILRDILEDDGLEARNDLSAADVPNWDSLAHLNIIVAVEKAFGIRFKTAEIAGLSKPDQNIGTFLALIASKRTP